MKVPNFILAMVAGGDGCGGSDQQLKVRTACNDKANKAVFGKLKCMQFRYVRDGKEDSSGGDNQPGCNSRCRCDCDRFLVSCKHASVSTMKTLKFNRS